MVVPMKYLILLLFLSFSAFSFNGRNIEVTVEYRSDSNKEFVKYYCTNIVYNNQTGIVILYDCHLGKNIATVYETVILPSNVTVYIQNK